MKYFFILPIKAGDGTVLSSNKHNGQLSQWKKKKKGHTEYMN